MIFYSFVTDGFYNTSLFAYDLPADAVELSLEQYTALMDALAQGMVIIADAKGMPQAVRSLDPSAECLLERAKNEIRAMRESMLSAVTGIGWDASVYGDTALVQEARNIRNALRDITDDPSLNAAKTYEEMRAAGIDAFRRIAAAASDAFSATFREFK